MSILSNYLLLTDIHPALRSTDHESVGNLVLAMGRSRNGFGLPVQGLTIRLIFLAAIPEEMNNEYLRILGAIARVCSEPESMEQLLAAPDAPSILQVLEKGCRQ